MSITPEGPRVDKPKPSLPDGRVPGQPGALPSVGREPVRPTRPDIPTRVDRAAIPSSDSKDAGTTARRVHLPQASDSTTPSPGNQPDQPQQAPQEAQSDERPVEPVNAGRRGGGPPPEPPGVSAQFGSPDDDRYVPLRPQEFFKELPPSESDKARTAFTEVVSYWLSRNPDMVDTIRIGNISPHSSTSLYDGERGELFRVFRTLAPDDHIVDEAVVASRITEGVGQVSAFTYRRTAEVTNRVTRSDHGDTQGEAKALTQGGAENEETNRNIEVFKNPPTMDTDEEEITVLNNYMADRYALGMLRPVTLAEYLSLISKGSPA